MAKIKTSVVFKEYTPQQLLLLPPSLEELISANHLVRVVNRVVDSMDISELINLYEGGGTSAYHPRMLLKVLLYGYCVKIYTGRKMAKALTHDLHFMWLSGMSRPDFRTLNNFRSSKAKHVIEVLFKEMLEFLMEHRYIKMEHYFCDGSTLRADANQYKMVWKKNAERFKSKVLEKCKALFKEIDALNATEDKAYGESDLEEHGNDSLPTAQDFQVHIQTLNEKIKDAVKGKVKRKAKSLKKKAEQAQGRIQKYDRQIELAGLRSGYNKTDTDASAMMMKNKVEILPAYNVLAGCEDQFITGISVHQNTNDGACFKEHLDHLEKQQPTQPEVIIADAIFGTAQNYELLEQKQISSYLKFPSFHAEQKQRYKDDMFLKDNFYYDPPTDTYSCPNDELLTYRRSYTKRHPRTGFESIIREYQCSSCSDCVFYAKCVKSSKGANRSIEVNEKLEYYKIKAREKLKSDEGIQLRKRRSIEIESCFGDIKHNMGFRRFHVRGLQKVKTEISLVAMAHNLRKVQLQIIKRAAGTKNHLY
jgi:transposase